MAPDSPRLRLRPELTNTPEAASPLGEQQGQVSREGEGPRRTR